MEEPADKLMGRWHEFAEQPSEVIERQFTRRSQMLVRRVLREGLGYAEVGKFPSAAEFAKYVVELRENERSWSRRLGDVILQAQGQLESGDIVAAKTTFEGFETTCPWRFFVEIAKTQRGNVIP